jgi:hypothetical protein
MPGKRGAEEIPRNEFCGKPDLAKSFNALATQILKYGLAKGRIRRCQMISQCPNTVLLRFVRCIRYLLDLCDFNGFVRGPLPVVLRVVTPGTANGNYVRKW